MSWEDCGFKPGKIDGPAKCQHACGDCDGDHHFYASSEAEEEDEDGFEIDRPPGWEPKMFFVCKHCGVKAEMVDEDSDEVLADQDAAACAEEEAGLWELQQRKD